MRSSIDMRNGFHGTIRPLLLEGVANLVDSSGPVHVEQT